MAKRNYKKITMNPPEPCPPHSECWCEDKPPNHPCHDQYVGIDSIVISIIMIILICYYTIKMKKL